MWNHKVKLRKTDTLFSKFVRQHFNWQCQRCGKNFEHKKGSLDNSHYWGRGHENTRFDLDNCTALCKYCHHHWGHGDGRDDYRDYMIKRLGQKGFDRLNVKRLLRKKRDDKMDEMVINEMLKQQELSPRKDTFLDLENYT